MQPEDIQDKQVGQPQCHVFTNPTCLLLDSLLSQSTNRGGFWFNQDGLRIKER